MIKYSLALLVAAAAVVGVVGCESECCGTPAPTAVIAGLKAGQSVTVDGFTLSDGGSHDNNNGGSVSSRKWTVDGQSAQAGDALATGEHEVCLLVTDNDGLTDKTCGTVIVGAVAGPRAIITQLPATCTPGETLNVSGSTSTGAPTSYTWEPSSVGTTASGTIVCPDAGASKEVCLTVANAEGNNRTCKTVTAGSSTCNPHITMTDPSNSDAEATTVTKGQKYDFHNNVVADDCPNVACTWSVRSHKTDNSGYFTCLIENSHVGTNEPDPTANDGSSTRYHVVLNGSGSTASINIQTCASLYNFFEVDLNCTNPTYNETKQYNLQ